MDTNYKLVVKKGKTISMSDNYEESFMEEYEQCRKVEVAVDKIITKAVRAITDAVVEAVKTSSNVFYIFKFNDDDNNGPLVNAKVDGLQTRYLLSEEWTTLYQKFNNKSPKNISQRILTQLKSSKFNNGVDPITKKHYKVSIFYYKKNTSKFDNGIMISRDGIIYS